MVSLSTLPWFSICDMFVQLHVTSLDLRNHCQHIKLIMQCQ